MLNQFYFLWEIIDLKQSTKSSVLHGLQDNIRIRKYVAICLLLSKLRLKHRKFCFDWLKLNYSSKVRSEHSYHFNKLNATKKCLKKQISSHKTKICMSMSMYCEFGYQSISKPFLQFGIVSIHFHFKFQNLFRLFQFSSNFQQGTGE